MLARRAVIASENIGNNRGIRMPNMRLVIDIIDRGCDVIGIHSMCQIICDFIVFGNKNVVEERKLCHTPTA